MPGTFVHGIRPNAIEVVAAAALAAVHVARNVGKAQLETGSSIYARIDKKFLLQANMSPPIGKTERKAR